MSDIASTIRLNDQMSDPLKKISGNVERLVGQLEKMGATSKSVPDDTSKYNSMADSLNNLFVAAGGYKVVQLVGSAFSASAKAAIEFESAVTGVYKTVDGTKEQLQGLSDAVKRMATEMPSTTTEIAAVMEASGQLGIATNDIERFTKTMIDLGNSTNLTAEQAATSLAKFANITGMSAQDYDRLGAVIVDLGNNFATTEADIVNMSTYLTSAATVAGLAETDIMGLSAAMISMGINAEAGGSSMSKLISQMQTAVEVGGDDLKAFASVADMTAEEFTAKWGSDAVGALQAFIGGLNDVERNGKSMSVILQDMDLDDIRMSNMIKALASGSDTLTAAVSKANAAWEENTALTNEVTKRYETLESKTAMMNNAVDNLKLSIGKTLTPAMGVGVDMVKGLAEKMSDLAESCPKATGAIMGASGAVSLLAGGAMTALPAMAQFSQVMSGFSAYQKEAKAAIDTAKAAGESVGAFTTLIGNLSLGKIGIAITAIAGLGAVIGGISGAFADAEKEVEDYKGTLEQCAREIEAARSEHQRLIDANQAESASAQALQVQLETLTAQYEKGGGAAADYAKRAEENSKAIRQMSDDYQKEFDRIAAEQSLDTTIASMLGSLSDNMYKTNFDLKQMGEYADRLNNKYECDIVVNYETGELLGFDPTDVNSIIEKIGNSSIVDAGWSFIKNIDNTVKYRDSLSDLYNAIPEIKNKASELNDIFYEVELHRNYKSPLKDVDVSPKYGFENYDYAKIWEVFQSGGYGHLYAEDEELYNRFKNSLSEYSDLTTSYFKLKEGVVSAENSFKTAFKDAGISGGEFKFLSGIKSQVLGTESGLAEIVGQYKAGFDLGSVSTDLLNIRSYMGDIRIGETVNEAEKANDAIKSSLTGMSEELMNTAQAYDEAYQAAYKSFSGQFGLFEDAEKAYKKTTDEITADSDSVIDSFISNANTQAEYFNKITESLETISSVDLSKVGMTAAEWDTFSDHMAELSSSGTEGAAGVNAVADAIENGNWDKVKEAAKAYEDAKTASANASGKVAEEVSNVEQMMDKTQKAIENTLTNVGLQAPTAHDKAKSVVDQLAAGVSAGYDNLTVQVSAVESLMARLASFGVSAEAPKKSSTTTSAPSGGSTTTSTSVAKYHDATGTTSAFPGLTLVGENGPELVDMTGGEIVYNASQTAKMMEQIGGISRSLGMEHGIGSLDSYSFHTFDTPEDDDELRLSDSDREYLIRLGERDAVNSSTNNDIKIEMINNNSISSEADVDGIIDYLAKGLREALVTSAEGVHR